jgi:poly(3-hydroxyalkanoate) depolymerase
MVTTAEVRSVAVRGRQLRVAVRAGRRGRGLRPGPAGRVPLLLINGIGASLELLEPFVAELDPALDVIRFDPPGVGGSAQSPGPYRFTGLCGLIADLLTELGYGQVDVLGISWGGAVAQHFATFQRDRCRRLVLVSTATGSVMVPARPSVLVHMVTPRRYLDRGYLERVAGRIYGGSARADPAGAAGTMNHGNRVGPSRGYLYQLTAGAGWTSLPFLPLLRQPTLIVAGDDDPLIPLVNARLMKRLIPRSQLHVYHGGHLGLVTEAAELAPVVDGFLTAPLARENGHATFRLAGRHRRRLLPARADARPRRPPAGGAGQGVHGEVGSAGHQPLLDPGRVPVRAGTRAAPAGHRGPGLRGLRLPRPELPAGRHDLDGAGPGRPVDRDVLRRAQRPGHGVHLPVRLR